MGFPARGDSEGRAALRDLTLTPFWLDDPRRPAAAPALVEDTDADLVVVGAGLTGLWTALEAVTRNPGRDVMLVDAGTSANAASGRNGGFCAHSLTHGLGNGLTRWPDDMPQLTRLGLDNLDGIEKTVRDRGIDCDFQRVGDLHVATEEYQARDLAHHVEAGQRLGLDYELLDADATRAMVNSPTYLAGVLSRRGTAMVNPARLTWGLRQACLDAGVRVHEQTPVTGLEAEGAAVRVTTAHASVRAARVALATNAFPSLLRRVRAYVVPVYDHVLMTEPLTAEQRASIGWAERVGIGDSGNQFHYYRMSEDGRILWGGYDAQYHWGNGFGPEHERDFESWARLSTHFFLTFPQLRGLRFSHGWAGAIDTCSRFSAFWGTAMGGRVGYVAGFTGLGVGASRFGAHTMLDLLDGLDTERTRLEMVRTKPIPFPPEPLRWTGITLTRRSLDRADRGEGRRNLWLRSLDRLGLGFDS